MSANKDHNKQYSAADIERYLRGQMSAEEMHQLETAALDDPFLADAIEGFQAAMEADKKPMVGLDKLNEEFNQRVKKPSKVVPITRSIWWQVVAAVLILVIVGVAYYNNWMNPKEKIDALATNNEKLHDSARFEVPKKEAKQPAVSDSMMQDTNSQTANRLTTVESGSSPARRQTEADQSRKITSPVIAKGKQLADEPQHQNAEGLARSEEVTNKPPSTNDTREKQTDVAASRGPETAGARISQSTNQLNNFSGRVVDPSNQPLPNASIQIIKDKSNLVTDQSGQFNFTAKDSVVDIQVDLVGYEQRKYRLQNNNASNELILEPSTRNMDEVVVSGYGKRRKKDVYSKRKSNAPKDAKADTTVKVQDAVPQIGWIEYEKYLEKNKRPPSSNPQLKGEVIVSFEVQRPDKLSDFKIEKSLSRDHDLEAIRLIREGPEWKLWKGLKSRVTVIVNF
jgi:negative regulator of sigma E activity